MIVEPPGTSFVDGSHVVFEPLDAGLEISETPVDTFETRAHLGAKMIKVASKSRDVAAKPQNIAAYARDLDRENVEES